MTTFADDTEKREYYRIKAVLSLFFRLLSKEEFLSLDATMKGGVPGSRNVMEDTQFEKDPATTHEGRLYEIVNYLQLMDKKLDMILDLLSDRKIPANGHLKDTEVEISGAGLKFISSSPMKVGDYAELRIYLPVEPVLAVTALAQVVRREPLAEHTEGAFGVAMRFVTIHEFDRDLIVKFIFKRERELLRQKRDETWR